jgi:hypothetical protein
MIAISLCFSPLALIALELFDIAFLDFNNSSPVLDDVSTVAQRAHGSDHDLFPVFTPASLDLPFVDKFLLVQLNDISVVRIRKCRKICFVVLSIKIRCGIKFERSAEVRIQSCSNFRSKRFGSKILKKF